MTQRVVDQLSKYVLKKSNRDDSNPENDKKEVEIDASKTNYNFKVK